MLVDVMSSVLKKRQSELSTSPTVHCATWLAFKQKSPNVYSYILGEKEVQENTLLPGQMKPNYQGKKKKEKDNPERFLVGI